MISLLNKYFFSGIRSLAFLLLFTTAISASAQSSSKIVSGPMIGYVEHREVLIWLEVAPNTRGLTIEYWKDGQVKKQRQAFKLTPAKHFQPVKLVLGGLDMNTKYYYRILINGQEVQRNYPLSFTTKTLWEHRMDPPDFSFLLGSCAYINDSIYDRPGKPYGQSLDIYNAMNSQPSDFIIWGGDNTYLREADWSSEYGISYRYHYNRKTPELQPLLASRPNYAIWDDHDYGPNDSDKSYELKDESRKTFSDYWGNKTYGHNEKGVYSKFTWNDAEFFLIDNRYFRSPKKLEDSIAGKANPHKDYLGEEQMQWLLQSLLSSKSRFKFIVTGSQFVSPVNNFENWRHYENEWLQLLEFIKKYKINGVVFLSGDRHFTEVNKMPVDGLYPIYDITSSPLSSRPFGGITKSNEAENPMRVENTLIAEQNFMKISVRGDRQERKIIIEDFDINNNLLWSLEIPYEEISIKK